MSRPGYTELDAVGVIYYLGVCGIYRGQAMDVMKLCHEAERKLGYWVGPHGERLTESFRSLIFHDATADRCTSYEPDLIPGLLQTADYARARISGERWRSAESIEHLVGIRMARQHVLYGDDASPFTFFVHEQTLRHQVGSVAIMHEQLLNLVLVTTMSQVTVRVVPSAAGDSWAFGGPFVMFEYDEHKPLDNHASGLFLEDPDYVVPYVESGLARLPAHDHSALGALSLGRPAPRGPSVAAVHGEHRSSLEHGGRAVDDHLAFCLTIGTTPEAARPDAVAAWIGDMHQRPNPNGVGLANSAIQVRIVGVRSFYDFLVEEGIRERNPVRRGQSSRHGGRAKQGLVRRVGKAPWIPNEHAWDRILRACEAEPVRNRLMVTFAYDGALRREELVSLEPGDLEPAWSLIHFFAKCPHRLACARCPFYLPKQSSAGRLLEVKDGVDQMLERLTLTDDERAALEGDRDAIATLAERLAKVPTPAGPTPEQLGTDRAFVALTAVQDSLTGERP